jgi:hypothetical protein
MKVTLQRLAPVHKVFTCPACNLVTGRDENAEHIDEMIVIVILTLPVFASGGHRTGFPNITSMTLQNY